MFEMMKAVWTAQLIKRVRGRVRVPLQPAFEIFPP